MFARSNDKNARPLDLPKGPPIGTAPPPPLPLGTRQAVVVDAGDRAARSSVIGSDLTILGAGLKIISQGVLQIDGEIMGDVLGAEIVISDGAKVTGLVNADKVVIRGKVAGTIKGMNVTLAAKADVEGDIHHQSLTIEQGALFEGKSRRPQDVADLRPSLDPSQHAGGEGYTQQ